MIPEFHTSREIATLGLSLFVAGLGLGPMVLSPLSEVRLTGPQVVVVVVASDRLAGVPACVCPY